MLMLTELGYYDNVPYICSSIALISLNQNNFYNPVNAVQKYHKNLITEPEAKILINECVSNIIKKGNKISFKDICHLC